MTEAMKLKDACSLEEKQCNRHCISVLNLDSVLKSRDIALTTKVRLVKVMGFPVVMYGCESLTIKKAEHRRIDAFELVLEKTVESTLVSKEIKSVNSKENQP